MLFASEQRLLASQLLRLSKAHCHWQISGCLCHGKQVTACVYVVYVKVYES